MIRVFLDHRVQLDHLEERVRKEKRVTRVEKKVHQGETGILDLLAQ